MSVETKYGVFQSLGGYCFHSPLLVMAKYDYYSFAAELLGLSEEEYVNWLVESGATILNNKNPNKPIFYFKEKKNANKVVKVLNKKYLIRRMADAKLKNS